MPKVNRKKEIITKLIKKKREDSADNRNKMDYKKILWTHANKLDNLEEMDKFLET